MSEWVWFLGVLLPKNFKDLEWREVCFQTRHVFKDIEQYLDEFRDQPICLDFQKNVIIGKIKNVWVSDDGELMIAGFINKKRRYNELAISFLIMHNYEGFSNFGCSLVEKAYYDGCVILESRKFDINKI